MCFFFKKIKNLLQFTFEKNNLFVVQKQRKNNLSRGKIPAPPLDIKWSIPYHNNILILWQVRIRDIFLELIQQWIRPNQGQGHLMTIKLASFTTIHTGAVTKHLIHSRKMKFSRAIQHLAINKIYDYSNV